METGKSGKALRPQRSNFKVGLGRKDTGFDVTNYCTIVLNWWAQKGKGLEGFLRKMVVLRTKLLSRFTFLSLEHEFPGARSSIIYIWS